MSAKLCFKLFCLTLLFILGVVQSPQAAHAAATVTVTNPGSFKTSDRPTLSVAVAGVTGSDTLALSLTTPNGAVLTSTGNGALGSNTSTLTANGTYSFMLAHITKPGTYTLTATLTGADTGMGTSTSFTVNPGVPATVAISTGPTPSTVSADNNFALSVSASDQDGNPVSGNVTLALFQSDGSTPETTAVLSDKSVSPAVVPPSQSLANGTANFNSLNINLKSSYKIKATVGAVISQASSLITIIPGAPFAVTVTAQPSAAPPAAPAIVSADSTFPVTVTVSDAETNSVAVGTTVTLSSSPAVALSGGTAVTTAGGTASFAGRIMAAGTYTLTASSGTASQALNPFTVVAGTPSVISFTQQPPSGTPAGAPFPSPGSDVKVFVSDASGNPVKNVGVSLSLLPSTGTLSNNAPQATGNGTGGTAAGVAVFQGLTVSPAGTYQLKATAGSASINSDLFTVTAGTANHLVFTQPPPASVVSGAPFTVTVQAEDAAGSTDTAYAKPVTLQLVTSPTGATLVTLSGPPVSRSASVTVTAVNGIATFSNLTPNLKGSYTVQATDGTFTTAAPNPAFAVVSGAAATLAFTAQPTAGQNIQAGAVIPVQVYVVDGNGNPVSNVSVTVSPDLGTINGTTTTLTGSDGKATYTGLYITKAASNIHIVATTSGIVGMSNSFSITAGAGLLSFAVQPTTTASGQPITPAVVVLDADAYGNPVSGANISLSLNSGTGTLSPASPTAVSDATGQATFSSLSVGIKGTYQLTAVVSGSSSKISNTFTITPGSGILSFSTQPSAASFPSGTALTPNTTVHLQDAAGNPIQGATISLTLSGTPTAGGAAVLSASDLPISPKITDSSGNAIFTSLSVDLAGSYQLQASAASLLPAPTPITTTNLFAITAGPLSALVFAAQPANAVAAGVIPSTNPPTLVTLTATDAAGNPVNGANINLALTTGTGTLTGASAPVLTDATGQATFGSLSIDKVGVKQLTATATLAAVTKAAVSSTFTISSGTGTILSITTTVANASSGTVLTGTTPGLPGVTAIVANLQDSSGNPLSGSITLALTGTPTADVPATLGGTVTVSTDANGNAVFSNLTVDKAGTYTLTASGAGAQSAASSAFAVAAGAPATVTITSPANAAPNAVIPAVTVTVADTAGNLVPAVPVTLSLAAATGTLTGQGTFTSAVPPANTGTTGSTLGVSSFTTLAVTLPGTYQLVATAGSASGRSSTFTIGNLPPTISGIAVTGLLDGTTGLRGSGAAHVGDTSVTVQIFGTTFVAGSTVTVGTTLLTSGFTVNSAAQITVVLPDNLLTRAGNLLVTVNNPDGLTLTGTLPSIPFNFPVYPLGPAVADDGTPHADPTTQYFNPGVQLFSVPFDYAANTVDGILHAFDVSLVPTAPSVTDVGNLTTLAVWDPLVNGYLLTTGAATPVFQDGITADSLVLGQGYWGRFQFQPAAHPRRQTGLSQKGILAGALTDTNKFSGQTFKITLQAGWNMIGDPFTGAVNLSLIQVQPLDGTGKPAGSAISLLQASDSGFVNDFFYKYVGGTGYVPVTPAGVLLPGGAPASSDNKLNPYVGYWAFSYQACQLLVPAP